MNSTLTTRSVLEGIQITLSNGRTSIPDSELSGVLTVEDALLFASRIINDCRIAMTQDSK